jgi:Putative zinc-finger
MNCEKCQELIHDLLDGTISGGDELTLKSHLGNCLDCESVRQDLSSIVDFCRTHRGEYEAPPNPQALWLRILNVVEASNGSEVAGITSRKSFLGRLMGHSWQLSLPQLAAFASAIVLVVSLATVVGLRRWETNEVEPATTQRTGTSVSDRVWQRQQVISYWNQRIELNKGRWSPEMRATFDRNLQVIDQAVSQSLNELNRNPHDEVSEQMLNESLNDKLALLKEFSDL